MSIEKFTKGAKVIAIACTQLGDSGKGKLSDVFAKWADYIFRGTGGANAGHTVIDGLMKLILHLIPSGIKYDKYGKINVIGNGVVYGLELKTEMAMLDRNNISYNNLKISSDANVVMPYHILLDQMKEKKDGKSKIGSTGRGISPVYAEKIMRSNAIDANILVDKDELEKRVKSACKSASFFLKNNLGYTNEEIANVLAHETNKEKFNNINFSCSEGFNIEAIIESYHEFGKSIWPLVIRTQDLIQEAHSKGKNILLEGAQGHGISLEHGIKTYLTGSECSLNGLCNGVGLSPCNVDICLSIVKFPYMTCVGPRPFPTEFGGSESEDYCGKGFTLEDELKKFSIPYEKKEKEIKYDHSHPIIIKLVNSNDPFEKGIGIRFAGEEYGATTGRTRRNGWTDLVLTKDALRYDMDRHGRRILVITKPDVLNSVDEYKICTAHKVNCEEMKIDGRTYNHGDVVHTFIRDVKFLRNVDPIYTRFDGWKSDLSECRDYDSLPENFKKGVRFVEQQTNAKVGIISVGPDRNQTIFREI